MGCLLFTFRSLRRRYLHQTREGLALVRENVSQKYPHNLNLAVVVGCTRRDNLGHTSCFGSELVVVM